MITLAGAGTATLDGITIEDGAAGSGRGVDIGVFGAEAHRRAIEMTTDIDSEHIELGTLESFHPTRLEGSRPLDHDRRVRTRRATEMRTECTRCHEGCATAA